MVKRNILGFILLIVSVLFLISTIIFKVQVDNLTKDIMLESGGTCIQEGICLHEQSNLPVYISISIIFVTFAMALYLIFFEKGEAYREKIQRELVGTLKETKKKQDTNEKFEFLLKALSEDEKIVMRIVKEEEGIEQATLRIRSGLSKTKLSVVLSQLAQKEIISKVPQGKKNKIYLKTKF